MLPARPAAPSLLFTLTLVIAAAWLPAGCGGGNAGTEAAATPEVDDPDQVAEPVSEDGADRGGWRWKGKRQDCFFRYGNRCFDKLQAACRAAGCQESQCSHNDAAPAVVACRK